MVVQRNTNIEFHQRINFEIGSQVAAGVISLANTAAAVMIFGQFLTHQPLDVALFFGGFILLIILYLFATLLLKRTGGN